MYIDMCTGKTVYINICSTKCHAERIVRVFMRQRSFVYVSLSLKCNKLCCVLCCVCVCECAVGMAAIPYSSMLPLAYTKHIRYLTCRKKRFDSMFATYKSLALISIRKINGVSLNWLNNRLFQLFGEFLNRYIHLHIHVTYNIYQFVLPPFPVVWAWTVCTSQRRRCKNIPVIYVASIIKHCIFEWTAIPFIRNEIIKPTYCLTVILFSIFRDRIWVLCLTHRDGHVDQFA